jgi:hypothetical protein
MTLISDGTDDRAFAPSARAVTRQDVIEVPMRGRGGFVMRIASH